MEPDGPDSPHASDDIDIALAALMKGLPRIATDDLETLLNHLPMPELGAKDALSAMCLAVCLSFLASLLATNTQPFCTATLLHSFGSRFGAIADIHPGAGNGSRLFELSPWM